MKSVDSFINLVVDQMVSVFQQGPNTVIKYSDIFSLLPLVGFLQSGTKLLFRRRHREKESCLSQSHEDISNIGNNFAAAATISRKKSGSFSRRLIKRFSFRTSGKSKGKATNGGASSLDN